jgi:serine/threonine protein kinase
MARPGGPPNFQAPDLNEPNYTEKADVFSFGLIFTELLTGSDFFSRASQMYVSARAATEFKPQWKPEFSLPSPVKRLAEQCWRLKPHERPSFARLLDEFDKLDYKFWDDVDPLEVREFIAEIRET